MAYVRFHETNSKTGETTSAQKKDEGRSSITGARL